MCRGLTIPNELSTFTSFTWLNTTLLGNRWIWFLACMAFQWRRGVVPRVSGSHLFPAGRPTDKDSQWILMESKTTKSLKSVNKILLAWVILGVRSFILERIYSPSITPVQLVFLGFSIRCRPPALHWHWEANYLYADNFRWYLEHFWTNQISSVYIRLEFIKSKLLLVR